MRVYNYNIFIAFVIKKAGNNSLTKMFHLLEAEKQNVTEFMCIEIKCTENQFFYIHKINYINKKLWL